MPRSVSPASSSPGMGSGVALVLASAISLQFGAACAVFLFPSMGAWGVTTFRLGAAALVLLLVVRPRLGTWNKQQWWASLLFGATMAGMNGFFYQSISLIPIGLAVAVEFAGPLVLSIILSRRRIDLLWSALATLGLGILGFEALTSGGAVNLWGIFFALVAGVFWALYILASAKVGQVIDGAGGLSVALLVATILIFPVGFSGFTIAFSDPKLLIFALLTGLLASVIPYSLEFVALKRIPRNVFSILLSLEPAVAALAGWALLQQETGLMRWIAIIFLIAASIGITRSAPSESHAATSPLEVLGYDDSPLATGALPTVIGFQTPEVLEDSPAPFTAAFAEEKDENGKN